MNLYSVNSLAVLKRIDLSRLPIARSVIASRAIAASSIPSSTPFSIHSSIPSSIPSTLPSSLPTFPSSSQSFKPAIPSTPSSIHPIILPNLQGLFKEDEVRPKPHVDGRTPLDKQFILSHLHSELNLPVKEAQQIYLLHGENLLKNYKNVKEFIQTCNLVKMFFTNEELVHNSFPFSLSHFELYNRIQIFKELGFRSINPSMIESHSQVFELTLGQLKRNFPHTLGNQTCMDSLCKTLEINDDDRKNLERSIIKDYGDLDSVPIERLRHRGLIVYLSRRLNSPTSFVESYCKNYRLVLRKTCLESMKRNVDLLVDRLPKNKILHNALFVALNSESLEFFFTKLENVVGSEAYRKFLQETTFLRLDVDELVANFQLLKSKCSSQFYVSSSALLKMPHNKLRAVLDEMENNVDVKTLNLKIFGLDYLAMNREQILGRFQKLRDEEIPLKHVPLSFFIASESDFMKLVYNIVKDDELRIKFYLEENFGVNYEEVKKRLRPLPKNAAPKYNKQNAKKIVEFFVSMNVSRDQIIDNVNLILLDYKVVKSAYYSARAKHTDQSLNGDPRFFDHIFDYILNKPKPK